MANFFDQFDSSGAAPAKSAPNYADAIASIESAGSGGYRAVGPATGNGDRALGRYQIMSTNIRPWSKEVLGREVTPTEFMSNPQLQDAIFEGKFGSYVQKYGPEGAAKAWFAGEKGMNNPNRSDVLGTTVSAYADKFNKAAGLPAEIATGQSKGGNFFDQFDAPQQATQSESGRPRVIINTNEPATVAQRMDMTGSQPGNAAELQPALVNKGAQMTAQPVDNFGKILIDFQNQGVAAGQRTTPNIDAQSKNLISANVQEGDDGNAYYVDPTSGKTLPTDSNKQVILRDPADGKLKVYARTDNTNEGVLSSAGRLLGTGLAAGAPASRMAAPVVQAVQELRPGQEVVAAAQRLSQTGAPVQVPRAVATDNMPVQQVAAAASNVPIAGTPLVKAAENTIGQLGTKADEVAQGFGGASSLQEAGDTAKGAIKNWIQGKSAETASNLYNRVDSLVDPNVRSDLSATRGVIADIAAKRSAAALPSGKATDAVLEAVQRPGGLTYDGIKTLRTSVGEMLKGGILPEGMSGSELQSIYGALSKDLETAVNAAGGAKASAAFNRANQYYRLASERRASLARIVGADGNASAESVMDRLMAMAGSSSRADISKLMQARKVIGADDWNEIASTVISRLGRDVEGDFSPQRFVTAYNKLSPAGRNILFRSGGKTDLAGYLDDIAKVSSRFKELQKFANPSGTARAGFGGIIGTGTLIAPLAVVKALVGGRVLASILSKPATAASVVKLAKAQEALVASPGPARLAAFNTAARNFTSTIGARELSPSDFLRAMQGPVPGRAQNEQQ
jgi:hypothetical protein